MKKLMTCLIAGAVSLSAVNAQDFTYSFKETYNTGATASLSISSNDGDIAVEPHDKNEILVYYIVKKGMKHLEVDRKGLEKENVFVETEHNGGNLKITVHYKNIRSGFTNWKEQLQVSFKIYAPRKTACTLSTSDGNVNIAGLTSDQQCKTSDGNISIADINGSITGNTSDGNIGINNISGNVSGGTSDGNIVARKVQGSADLHTSDGNIELSGVNGDVVAKTSDGHISFEALTGSFKGITSDGDIRGTMTALKKQLSASTGDGNIRITIPNNLGLDLTVRGESLNVPLDNFSGKSEKKFIKGKSNGGGIPVDLSASDGNITLAYAN